MRRIAKPHLTLPAAAVAVLTPQLALAHAEVAVGAGLVNGLLHPILGPDHLIAMVAVGLWGAQLRAPLIWALPIAFPLMMAVGGVLGVLGLALPSVEVGIAASALALGLLIAFAVRAPVWAAVAIVSAFALFHGHAHGTELPHAANPRLILQFEITTFAGGDFLLFVRDITRVVQTEQMRRDFVGNVSHELRTPLTVFKGYLDTLDASEALRGPPYAKAIVQMNAQVQRMENLLTDLLWLSRIESVREERKTEAVDMAGMLEELREELRSSEPERLVVLELKTCASVSGDYPQLRSAVSNLVINALKYSEEHEPVSVRWEREGDALCLTVADRGLGIEELHLSRITERFYRVDESRSARTGGTGLGLAIVKHVAASHRAELDIQSEPGRGSRFALRFPLS